MKHTLYKKGGIKDISKTRGHVQHYRMPTTVPCPPGEIQQHLYPTRRQQREGETRQRRPRHSPQPRRGGGPRRGGIQGVGGGPAGGDDVAGAGADLVARGVHDVVDGGVGEGGGGAELVLAGGLVGGGPVEPAALVVAPGAEGVEDVVEDVVVLDPVGVGAVEAAGEEVHAVGGAQGHLAVAGVDEVGAAGDVDVLVLHRGGAAGGGPVGGAVARVEVVPGVVADVVGALGLVDAQQVDVPAPVAERDAQVGAVDRVGPVGDAVRVDLAAEHADRGRVAVVGRHPDGALAGGDSGEEEGREEDKGGDGGGEAEAVAAGMW